MVPWPHSSSSKPPLGSHPHIPKFSSEKTSKRQKDSKTKEVFAAAINRTNDYEKKPNYSNVGHSRNSSNDSCTRLVNDSGNSNSISMIDSSEDSNPQNNSLGKGFLAILEFMMHSWVLVNIKISLCQMGNLV